MKQLESKQNSFFFDYGMFIVDGFYRYEEHERTNFNKKGSSEDQKIRVVPIPDNIAPTLRREVEGETVRKIAGHNSLAMTDYYTRAAIQEMVEAVKPAVANSGEL